MSPALIHAETPLKKMDQSDEKMDQSDEKETCTKLLQSKPHVLPQIKSALTASLGLFACGAINGWSGAALTSLSDDFDMATTEYSLVVSLISYGAILGCLLSGKWMDFLGRKRLLMASTPLLASGWVLIGAAPSIAYVYVGRFLCGFSSGLIMTSASIYTSETAHASIRGRLNSLTSIFLTLGILTTYILGGLSWRLSAFIFVILILLFLGCLCLVPESPYWYLLKGHSGKANKSLSILRGSGYNIETEINEIKHKLADVGEGITYKELLKRRTLLPLTVALFIQTVQQLSGGNIIMMYTSRIFEKTNSSLDPHLATVYTGIAQLTGTILSLFVIDKYGRRLLLFFSVLSCGIFMSLFGVYFFLLPTETPWPTWCPLVILIGLVFSYCLGCRSIPWIISSELFNTAVRSRANSVTIFYNRIMNLIVVQVYPYQIEYMGDHSVYFTYGFLSIIFATGILLFVPETKGKTLEEVQAYFESKTRKVKKSEKTLLENGFISENNNLKSSV